ncbi:MAG: pilus assembly protein PilM [Synergistaceae bacterium]|nr:pilus assembly protein PilM [Synergistaceae bacterium]
MALFTIKKKYTAGLFIDGDKFQCLTVKGSVGNFSVIDYISDIFPFDNSVDKDSLINTKDKIDSCFSTIDSKILDKKTPIHIALPISDSLLRIVNLPGMSLDEAKLAFRYEFENYFPFPLKEGIFDVTQINFPLINKDSEKRFLVVAARLSLIDNIMSSAASYGFTIAGIEPAQISIEKAITSSVHLKDSVVYIYAGRFRSVMILSWQGNGIFYRSISLGFDGIKLNVDAEVDVLDDALQSQTVDFVKEIRFSLQFALSQIRGFNPQSVYICGPGANDEMVLMLKEALSIDDISTVDCLALHQVDIEETNENWDIPLGAILR